MRLLISWTNSWAHKFSCGWNLCQFWESYFLERRVMVRRAAMAIWKREHPPGPGGERADRKFPLEDLVGGS
jgi:hypothetical protein